MPDPVAGRPADALPAERWEGWSAAELAERWGAPRVELYARAGSTNDLARRLADGGAASGTVVLADEQTAGRGRVGRQWVSPPGLGIWLSLVARPRALPEPGLLPLVVGVAVARALDPFAGAGTVQVKWPNDLLVGGAKVGGILCEGAWEEGAPSHVVVGIGLNVLHAPADFPLEIAAVATSLRIAGAGAPSREEVAGAVVRAVANAAEEVPVALPPAWAAELEHRDALRGKEIVVLPHGPGEERRGMAVGVAPDGALLLRTPSGALRRIRSGTVRVTSV